MSGFAQPPLSAEKERSLYPLAGIGVAFAGLTAAAPFAFQAGGDNAFIALAIPASLLTLAAAQVAERTRTNRALWLIFGTGIIQSETACLMLVRCRCYINGGIWETGKWRSR